jgi:hypothetical protein
MKKIVLPIFILLFAAACKEKEIKRPTNAMDVGNTFIRATLDGDFKNAEVLVYKDSANSEFFQAFKRTFESFPADKKAVFKNANYTINSFTETNDSVNIIDYSNDYLKQSQKIKLIKKAATWSVDFKYTTGDTTTVTK